MKTSKNIIIAMLLCLSLACNKGFLNPDQSRNAQDLLVKDKEIPGWSISGPGWVAYNMDELTTYINGAAELYYKHGFVQGAFQSYEGKVDNIDSRIELTIYDQGSESNALALYEDPFLGFSDAEDWNGAGQAAHYVRYEGLSQVLSFYYGKYLILVQIDIDTEESLDIIKKFALHVNKKFK